MDKRVAIILHKNESKRSLPGFAIWHLANVWQQEGIRVVFLFGTQKFIPADLAVLHVDLTAVPGQYAEFALKYPCVLNGQILDIRKSAFSRQKLNRSDAYEGKVIVKSELNYAGEPERKLLGSWASRLSLRITTRFGVYRCAGNSQAPVFRSPAEYRILDTMNDVPREWFEREDIIVEKFLPERQDGLYCLRNCHLLGDRAICVLRRARSPIVNNATVIDRREIELDEDIVRAAKAMGMNFGKIDYVVHNGRPHILDINKTPGAGKSPAYTAMVRRLAEGIRQYL